MILARRSHRQTPPALADIYRQEFLQQLPLIQDGDYEAIHQARVTTRRLREALPLLVHHDEDAVTSALATAKQLGKALGVPRELDVLADVLSNFERRLPATAAVTSTARAALRPEQLQARRELVKKLDRTDLNELDVATRPGAGPRFRLDPAASWRRLLWLRLGMLGGGVHDAVRHATGVYFPNRSHALRIAVKKLRYAVEIADTTSLWRPPNVLSDLKRIQARLGELHDVQLVQDRLRDLAGEDLPERQVAALHAALEAEAERRHGQFLSRRNDLSQIAEACRVAGERGAHRLRPSLVVSLLTGSRRITSPRSVA